MVEIPADAGAGLGVFEDLHGYPDGAAFAVALTDAAATHYGTPFVAFIEALIRTARTCRRPSSVFATTLFPGPARHRQAGGTGPARGGPVRFGGRGRRVGDGGGITGWPEGAAHAAAERCFGDWLKARGGSVSAEERELLIQVRLFVRATRRTGFAGRTAP